MHTLPLPEDRYLDIGFRMYVRAWEPPKGMVWASPGFLLVHGLSSNASTWDMTARRLMQAGHPAYAVDQRSHGLSEKLNAGFDFDTLTADLARLLAALGLEKALVAGQSWGGHVAAAFGAHYPAQTTGIVLVDGGIFHLAERGPWEVVSRELAPPAMDGMPRQALRRMIAQGHPDWDQEALEVTLANFETLPDGSIKRNLSVENHLKILHAMYHAPPGEWLAKLSMPAALCVADDRGRSTERKKAWVAQAVGLAPHLQVNWFENTDHDIHVHKPAALADFLLNFAQTTRGA